MADSHKKALQVFGNRQIKRNLAVGIEKYQSNGSFFYLRFFVSKKLFVGSLPWTITDDSLKTTFEPHGKVVSAKIVKDRATGRSRGFGFVEMESDADAQKAIEVLHESEVDGRKITVSEARPK